MHICHLAKYYPPATGGIESHVQTLARGQSAAGECVTVLCVNHRSINGENALDKSFASTPAGEENDEGVRVIRARRQFQFSKWDYSPGLINLIRRLQIDSPPVDLLHLHAPNVTMTLALLVAATTAPLVVTHHSDIIKQAWLGKGFEMLERKLLRRAQLILTDSPCYAEGSRQLRGFPDKVRSLPLGIKLEPFLEPSAQASAFCDLYRMQFGVPLWLAVGRLVYYKGLETAIAAMVSLPGTLAIVGEGPLRSKLEGLAAELGVAERVKFLGRVGGDELVGAYHAATALLFPSNARSESFGLVQVEAMASGCPVINTNIEHSGVAWVSRHEESGLTVTPNSVEELVGAARKLLCTPDLRERLADGAVLRARMTFDQRTMVADSLRFYRTSIHSMSEQ